MKRTKKFPLWLVSTRKLCTLILVFLWTYRGFWKALSDLILKPRESKTPHFWQFSYHCPSIICGKEYLWSWFGLCGGSNSQHYFGYFFSAFQSHLPLGYFFNLVTLVALLHLHYLGDLSCSSAVVYPVYKALKCLLQFVSPKSLAFILFYFTLLHQVFYLVFELKCINALPWKILFSRWSVRWSG